MELGEFSLRVLFYHLLPSITTVLVGYGFVLGVTRLLRIHQPNWLYLLLLIPLLKGLVVLVRGVSPPGPPTDKPFLLGIKLWDPLGLLSPPAALDRLVPLSPFTAVVAAAALLLLAIGLSWRWGSLLVFYRTLRCGESLLREDAPRLFQILDALVAKMGVEYPRVVVSDRPYIFPCTVGIRPPVIVMSPELVEESSDEEVEAILAHEMAHLKRRDNVVHWIWVAVRDILFFNPFAHLVFSTIVLAKEKDCDRIAARVTGKPGVLSRVLLELASAGSDRQLRSLPGDLSTAESFVSRTSGAAERIKALHASTGDGPRTRLLALAITMLLTALGFLLNLYFADASARLVVQVF
ncbi:MAG: M56 family metallopeptidase [Chloroflexi bacterium]|nr:M56 family metallopeptidase [Chloroflexota bacterium]